MNAPANNNKTPKPPQAARRAKSSRLLREGEAGLAKIVRQINKRLDFSHEELAALELTWTDYARLANVLTRAVEAGLKCEKHREPQKAERKCLDQPGLSNAEDQLHLF
jgi:hypothetical protein